MIIPFEPSLEQFDLAITLQIVIISIPLRSSGTLFSLVSLGSNLAALFVLFIILTLASFITVIEHAVLIMAEIDLAAWG